MSHKNSKHKCSESKKKYSRKKVVNSNIDEKNNYNANNNIGSEEISQDDILSLNLLNTQLNLTVINMYATILLYIATMLGIKVIYSKYNGEAMSASAPDEPSLQATYIFLITRLLFAQIAFTRYDVVYNKKQKGEFEYSLTPNVDINIANVLGIISSLYFVKGAEGIKARNNNQPVFGVR